jgi:hypothetical protein
MLKVWLLLAVVFDPMAGSQATHAAHSRTTSILTIGERPYLSTKIITLSEFFNFVHQVSRL